VEKKPIRGNRTRHRDAIALYRVLLLIFPYGKQAHPHGIPGRT